MATGYKNNTEDRQSVNHFAQNIQSHTIAMKKICAIKSMAPLQHNDTAITDSIIQYYYIESAPCMHAQGKQLYI